MMMHKVKSTSHIRYKIVFYLNDIFGKVSRFVISMGGWWDLLQPCHDITRSYPYITPPTTRKRVSVVPLYMFQVWYNGEEAPIEKTAEDRLNMW